MMVNCLKCKSKVDDRNAWRAKCNQCSNYVAICIDCMESISKSFRINCCHDKDYEMMKL